MKDMTITKANKDEFFQEFEALLEKEKALIVSAQPANTGKWGMAKLWRVWMLTTATWMANNGATMPLTTVNLATAEDGAFNRALNKLKQTFGQGHNLTVTYGVRAFNSNDAHELFTSQWLGVDEQGHRLSWAKKGNDDKRVATKGERFNALRLHEEWCITKGINLLKPRGSDYEKLQQEQNQ